MGEMVPSVSPLNIKGPNGIHEPNVAPAKSAVMGLCRNDLDIPRLEFVKSVFGGKK